MNIVADFLPALILLVAIFSLKKRLFPNMTSINEAVREARSEYQEKLEYRRSVVFSASGLWLALTTMVVAFTGFSILMSSNSAEPREIGRFSDGWSKIELTSTKNALVQKEKNETRTYPPLPTPNESELNSNVVILDDDMIPSDFELQVGPTITDFSRFMFISLPSGKIVQIAGLKSVPFESGMYKVSSVYNKTKKRTTITLTKVS